MTQLGHHISEHLTSTSLRGSVQRWFHSFTGARLSGAVGLLLLISACGARSVEHRGGESHFLLACNDDCGGGLTCIGGACTKPCEGNANCSALNASATCVEQKSERAVCDVECKGDGACEALGGNASCVEGVCRVGSTLVPEVDAAATGPSSPVTDDATPSSSSPGPGSSAAQPNDLDGGGVSPQGVPVHECPEEELPSDPIDVHFSYIDDYTLTLDVSHSAGCARHDYSVCYGPWTMESDPLQIKLRLVHDAHGETCEALGGGEIRFSLSELAAFIERVYPTAPVFLVTNFGTLAPGPLACEDQQTAVNYQLRHVIGQLDLSCVSDEQCDKVPVATDCFQTCDQVVSTRENHRLQGEGNGISSMALLQREVTRINDSVCGAYADECGEPATGPLCAFDSCNPACNNEGVPRCIDSVCQLSDE